MLVFDFICSFANHVLDFNLDMKNLLLFVVIAASAACGAVIQPGAEDHVVEVQYPLSKKDSLMLLFHEHQEFWSDGFDFPVGKPDAKGYYNAQGFQKNEHLGDDWNGRGGGNTDFGDTIYSISNGYVTEAFQFYGGWGKVMRIASVFRSKEQVDMVESLYAHMNDMLVKKGQWVKKGQAIGTIGNAEGIYLAHLHHEIRNAPGRDLGAGYGKDTTGYLNPTLFIKSHRR